MPIYYIYLHLYDHFGVQKSAFSQSDLSSKNIFCLAKSLHKLETQLTIN